MSPIASSTSASPIIASEKTHERRGRDRRSGCSACSASTLSPFAAGAIVAALLAAAFAGYSGLHGLQRRLMPGPRANARRPALQAQIDTLKADRDAARRALADERLRLAAIEKQRRRKEGTAAYVEDLKRSFERLRSR
jgi:hypothetical protein